MTSPTARGLLLAVALLLVLIVAALVMPEHPWHGLAR